MAFKNIAGCCCPEDVPSFGCHNPFGDRCNIPKRDLNFQISLFRELLPSACPGYDGELTYSFEHEGKLSFVDRPVDPLWVSDLFCIRPFVRPGFGCPAPVMSPTRFTFMCLESGPLLRSYGTIHNSLVLECDELPDPYDPTIQNFPPQSPPYVRLLHDYLEWVDFNCIPLFIHKKSTLTPNDHPQLNRDDHFIVFE